MKRNSIVLFLVSVFALIFGGCRQKKTEVVVLAAASLTDVCGELEAIYEKQHGTVELLFSFGSSGALQAQIEEGVTADLFLSADIKQVNALKTEGLLYDDSIVNLLENKLVLVVPQNADNHESITSFEDIATDKVRMIGLGEPKSVPAGRYAMEVFDFLGLSDIAQSKANYGLDVRAVLAWVEEGAVDCGIVYQTDAFSSNKVKIVAQAPEGSLRKVMYPAALVKNGESTEEAKDFLRFLQTDTAMQIFTSHGFARAE